MERRYLAHQADDEIAGADKRIDDMNAFIGERTPEFGLEQMFYALHHEIDNRLWCINDAVRIGDFGGVALKKLFVDGIEEVLFLREIGEGCRLTFNFPIERLQVFEECVAAICILNERVDNLLYLACDDVPLCEVRIVKDGAEGAFCQEMLEEHLFDSGFGEVGVNRGLAELMELGEGGSEARTLAVTRLDEFLRLAPQCWHGITKFGNSGAPLGGIFTFVGEECLQHGDKRLAFGDVRVQHLASVLIKNGAFRGLEEDVVLWVAGIKLGLDFGAQVAFDTFRLPGAAGQVVFIKQCAIEADERMRRVREVSPTENRSARACPPRIFRTRSRARACPPRTFRDSQRIFTDERPIQLSRAGFQECLKGGADSSFVGDTALLIGFKCGVVDIDGLTVWFEVECRHYSSCASLGSWSTARIAVRTSLQTRTACSASASVMKVS